MSKKSRKRNKKILGLLGTLGLGLALANRGKGTEMSNISVDSGRGGDSSSAKARAIANAVTTAKTIQDNMPVVSKKKSILADPRINKMDLSEVDLDYKAPNVDMSQFRNMDMGLEGYMPMKKGGRAIKTKKGGRAVRKANRSKKK